MEPINISRPPLNYGHDREGNDDERRVRDPAELLSAASSGDLELLEEFLRREDGGPAAAAEGSIIHLEEARPSALYQSGASTEETSALHVVAASGDHPRYLLVAEVICRKAGELLFACDGNGDTPLHCAVRAGNAEMASLLIGQVHGFDQRKAMVRMQNKRGETALHEAVRFGHKAGMRMVEALMAVDRELARVVASDGTSPLYVAASLHQIDIVRELISHDKELSYSGPLGQNALYPAVFRSRVMTKALLNFNKDMARQQDLCGSTPAHFAASVDGPSIEFFLYVFMEKTLEFYSLGIYFAPQNCLMRLYRFLNFPLYQLLGADPSSAFRHDKKGLFPIHVAASAGNLVAVIILLVMCPGCAALRDRKGRTFLHTAVEKGSHATVKLVRKKTGLNSILNIQDHQGNTAVHLAVDKGHFSILQTLIVNPHVRLNLANYDGMTPLDLAESKVPRGLYFGMHARRRILDTLTFVDAQYGNDRRDIFQEKHVPQLDTDEESNKKITQFAQIIGICSVLVATATFAAGFAVPGGLWTDDSKPPTGSAPTPGDGPIGTPILAGKYAFDGFVLANTLAFSCSSIATFSLIIWGMAVVDIENRIKLLSMSLALLNGAARSFCAAFAFAFYLLLSPVTPTTAIATATIMAALVFLDALRVLWLLFIDTVIVLNRRGGFAILVKLSAAFLVNMVYLLWPYIIIFSLLGRGHKKSALHSH